ncbi:MAG: GNAT family N-acetyltransferase [Anaerorhabdus sp.]
MFRRYKEKIAYVVDKKTLARIEFLNRSEDVIEVYYTHVEKCLEGQKMSIQLMEQLVKYLKETNKKVIPLCIYTDYWFRKNPQHADLVYHKRRWNDK